MKSILTICLTLLIAVDSLADATSKRISSLKEFSSDVESYSAQNPNSSVLIVFDIDDTLLESAEFFGGDTWYNWSRGREMVDGQGNPIVIDDSDKISCIFSKLGTFFDLARHHPTESGVAQMVAEFQKNYSVMALTSRSPDYRGGTERELQRASIEFAASHLLEPHQALAYTLPDSRGNQRKVTYQAGIVMSSGLNKGQVLDDLLSHKLERTYDTVFFVDDGANNIENMTNHYRDRDMIVTSYLYEGVDKSVTKEKIEQARKSRALFNQFLEAAFTSRYNEFAKGECG